MKPIIIDADGMVLGRVCSYAAKKALLGEEVVIVNAEKAIISGKKDMVLRKEKRKLEIRNLGNPAKGPFHQKRPDKYVRRAVRGMLPWHKFRGREAYRKVMVYIGFPADEIKKKYGIEPSQEEIQKPDTAKKKINGVTVEEVCKALGGRI